MRKVIVIYVPIFFIQLNKIHRCHAMPISAVSFSTVTCNFVAFNIRCLLRFTETCTFVTDYFLCNITLTCWTPSSIYIWKYNTKLSLYDLLSFLIYCISVLQDCSNITVWEACINLYSSTATLSITVFSTLNY